MLFQDLLLPWRVLGPQKPGGRAVHRFPPILFVTELSIRGVLAVTRPIYFTLMTYRDSDWQLSGIFTLLRDCQKPFSVNSYVAIAWLVNTGEIHLFDA